ncbi:MAG: vWA domain-containing protein [Candidatus Acidiferrales bacterium]
MKRATIASLCVLIPLCVMVPSAFAQSGETRTIPLVVMTRDGGIVSGLASQNVQIKGLKGTVGNITPDTGPRRIVLLLDISASMEEPTYNQQTGWQYAKEMVQTFLSGVRTQDSLALYVFAEKERQIVPLTRDFTSIRAAIDALPEPDSKRARSAYGRTTRAGEALQAALLDLGQEPDPGDSAIFFSDGELGNDESRHSLESLTTVLGSRGVRVFLALALQDGPNGRFALPYDFTIPAVSDSFGFMAETGGFSFTPAMFPVMPALPVCRMDPLERRVAALNAAVQGTYRVQLQLKQPLRKRQDLELELLDNRRKEMHNVYLLYPHTLYPDLAKKP